MGFVRRASVGLLFWIIALIVLYLGIRSVIPVENEAKNIHSGREREIAVQVIRVEKTAAIAHIDSTGSVKSRKIQHIKAPHAGEIIFIAENFKEGSDVQHGDLLLRITPFANNAQGQAQLNVATEDIKVAQHTLKYAKSEYERQKTLFKKGIVNQKSVEQAEDALNLARQHLTSKQAAIITTNVFANFDGNIRNKNSELNQLISANETLAEIIDDKNLEVAIRLSENQYRQLMAKQSDTNLSITITNRRTNPNISEKTIMDRQTLSSSGERIIYANLSKDTQFYEGDFIYVRLQLPTIHDAIVIPEEALSTDNSVWRITGDSRLERVNVDIIAPTENGVIIEGLAPDSLIVRYNQPHLGEGSKVMTEENTATTITLNTDQINQIRTFLEENDNIPEEMRNKLNIALKQRSMNADSFEKLKQRIPLK